MARRLFQRGIFFRKHAQWTLVVGIFVCLHSSTVEAQTTSVNSQQSNPATIVDNRALTTPSTQGARSRLRSASPRPRPLRQSLSAEEIDTFGFDDVDPRTEKALEKYRKTQRRYGFERAGRGVDVEAGYEAAGKNSIRR